MFRRVCRPFQAGKTMEQNFPPHHVIVDWLADYTHFICDHFSLPRDQADGLLQQYLNPTARGPPQQPTTSPYEQSSGSSEAPNLYPEAHFQEQLPNPYLATYLMPLNHPVPSNPHHDARVEEDADHLSSSRGMLARNTTSQGQFVAYEQQPGNMMTTNSDLPEASITSPQPTQTLNQTPIGSITDYDPLWIQNNNVDPLRVTQFRSDMKFDTLFSQRVIKLGDVLIFQVSTTTTNGQTQKTEAHLKVSVHSFPLEQASSSPEHRSLAHHEAQQGPVCTPISPSAWPTLRGCNTRKRKPAAVPRS